MQKTFFFTLCFFLGMSLCFSQTWEYTNGTTPGNMLAFTKHNTHWFIAADGGTYHSNDNGQTWASVLDAYHCADIFTDVNRIWVANYEGLRYSDDDGGNWTFSPVVANYEVSSICKHNNVLWVATKGSGAYRLNGATWVAENNGLPTQDDKFLLQIIEHKGNLYAAGGQNIYQFDDGTSTWNSLGILGSNLPYPAGHSSIASDGTNLYTAVYGWGFYYSTDDGLTWTQKNNGLMNMNTGAINKVVAHNGTVWVGGGTGLYKHNYPFTGNWQVADASFDIYALYSDNSLLVAGGNPNGFTYSTDNGLTWQGGNTGFTDYIQSITTDGTNIYTAGVGSMISRLDGAGTWSSVSNFGTVSSPGGVAVAFHNNKLYASRYGDLEMYRSANTGTTWTQISTGIPSLTTPYFIKGEGAHLYAHFSDYSLYRSDNEGNSWTQVGLQGHSIVGLTFENSKIWAATDSGIFSSTNLGVSWTYHNLADKNLTNIAYSNGRMFASTNDEGIYISDDNGTTWTLSNTGLAANHVTCFYTNGNFILAGTLGYGVFYSNDNGNTWVETTTGLANYYVTCITMKGNEAYIGTVGGGIWKADMSLVLSIKDNIMSSYISLYPNPSEGNFSLISAKMIPNAHFSIQDIAGKEQLLQNITLMPNVPQTFQVELPQGIYLIEIRGENYQEVKKLIIK